MSERSVLNAVTAGSVTDANGAAKGSGQDGFEPGEDLVHDVLRRGFEQPAVAGLQIYGTRLVAAVRAAGLGVG